MLVVFLDLAAIVCWFEELDVCCWYWLGCWFWVSWLGAVFGRVLVLMVKEIIWVTRMNKFPQYSFINVWKDFTKISQMYKSSMKRYIHIFLRRFCLKIGYMIIHLYTVYKKVWTNRQNDYKRTPNNNASPKNPVLGGSGTSRYKERTRSYIFSSWHSWKLYI